MFQFSRDDGRINLTDITTDELKDIQIKKKAYDEALKNGSTEMPDRARQYHDAVINAILTGDLPIEPGCGANPDPTNEHVKEGGWGGDTAGATTWESVPMKDDPSLWKVVDKEGKNIAHKFESEAEADAYIKYHQCIQEKGDTDTPPEPPTTEPEPPKPEPEPVEGDYPYAVKGNLMPGEKKGPLTRHYQSGKEDDRTVEMNVKKITFSNYMFVVDVTMHEMEHDDTLSLKYGGTHMGSGWFDNTIGVYTGKTGLGTEKKHPSAKLFIVKGPEIGDIREKRIKVAGIYCKVTNKCELWTNLGTEWVKQVEGKDVGGFNPKSNINEAQLRIDGWKKEPTIHSAVVVEIGAQDQ